MCTLNTIIHHIIIRICKPCYLFTYIDTLTRGRQEYNRLITIRTTSLTNIISIIRHDIYTLWVEMGVTSVEDQKREFESYFVGIEQLTDSAVSICVHMYVY